MVNGDSLLKHILVLAPLSNKEKHALDAKKVWLKALTQAWFEMWSLQGFGSWMVIESTYDWRGNYILLFLLSTDSKKSRN